MKSKKSSKKKNTKKSVKKIAKKAAPKKRINKPQKATSVPPVKAPVRHFSRTREVIAWGFVVVFIFAVLSVLASYSNLGSKDLSSFQQKIKQASLMSLSDFSQPVTLMATGDIMLARYVELKMRRNKDYTYPFKNVAEFLKSADVTFGNLESPFFPGANTPKNSMTFRADANGVQGLQAAGYDVVSLANNHIMNYRVSGLTTTLQALKKAEILPSGGGKDQDAAHTPALVEVKGKKIAFQSYIDESIPPRVHGVAKYNTPGIARMDIESMQNDVKNALVSGTDIVVVSMHAGKEYTRQPTQFQKDFAHAAVDAGAAIVIGHHPHWVQPVEYYNNGIIFYSLGNFVFDQFFSQDVKTGIIAKIIFVDGEKPAAELIPVRIENSTQPRILEGSEREAELKRLGLL